MAEGPSDSPRFWERPLESLSAREWEALCDGCGRCCLKKFEDEDSGALVWTRVVCRYFQESSSSCQCYEERTRLVPDCFNVRDLRDNQISWMPDTCAYRLRGEGKPLYDWHPLIAGDRNAMERAGIAVSGRILSEEHVHPDGYEDHIIRWVES